MARSLRVRRPWGLLVVGMLTACGDEAGRSAALDAPTNTPPPDPATPTAPGGGDETPPAIDPPGPDAAVEGVPQDDSLCGGDLVPVNGECVPVRQPEGFGPGWNEIKTGGDTLCVNGDEYSFFVRQGTVNRVLLFLQGGGACWDAITCSLPLYTATVSAPGSSGILDPDNPDNPFRDWHMVYLPYCSADVFFGNVDQNYLGRTVHHRGFVNAEAARQWAYENITAPEVAFVSGCSAGAVGVIMHGTYMAEAYKDNPNIRSAMVTDSFQGIIPESFAGIENWNVVPNIPPWLPELKEPPFNMTRAILAGAPLYPESIIAHFNYANDAVQSTFYGAMGGNPAEIPGLIDEAVHTLADSLDNYRFYTAPGSNHCVFESDDVYTTTVADVNLAQWLGRIATGETVGNVEP